jgi:hypothetical protein
MKTLKKTILILSFLLVACGLVKAERPNKASEKANDILIKYLESTTIGQRHDLNELLSDDFKQYIDCDRQVLNYNKKQFIKHLKSTENFVTNCISDYSFVEEKENFVIAKIEKKFPTFTKTDYVTMSNIGKGWRITSISIHYN